MRGTSLLGAAFALAASGAAAVGNAVSFGHRGQLDMGFLPPRLTPGRTSKGGRRAGRVNPAGTKLAKKALKGQIGMGKPQ